MAGAGGGGSSTGIAHVSVVWLTVVLPVEGSNTVGVIGDGVMAAAAACRALFLLRPGQRNISPVLASI